MGDDTILSVKDLTVQFGGVRANDAITFDVERGELFALIGPNGAGKTTLVNAISGVYVPAEETEVRFTDGKGQTHDLIGQRPFQIARLGVARTFQNLGLFPSQTVLDNLMLGRYIHENTGAVSGSFFNRFAVRKELAARKRCEEVIELLEIGQYRWEVVANLPYGVQKRIELGRVLTMEPEFLFLDEPMAGMTVEEKQDMVRYMYAILDELDTTMLIIEHDMGVVMSIAERVMVVDFGKRIALDVPDVVQRDETVIAAYLGAEDAA
ncbi:MAG: ABC transporter ATP-binding protein [Acidimicrobiales bacterium]